MGSDPTVVNLSPEALIYHGFRALFLYKRMKYFIKITWHIPQEVRPLRGLLIKELVRLPRTLNHTLGGMSYESKRHLQKYHSIHL